MPKTLNTMLKLLGIFVLAAVAVGILLLAIGLFSWAHHRAAHTARQMQKNASIKVLRIYASPPNRTLAWRFYLVKNTSGKTITALKFRVTVFNQLHEKIDRTVVSIAKPIAANAQAYCDIYTIFDADTGVPIQSGSYVDRTDKRLVEFATHEVGCKPQDLQVQDPYKVKVLAIACANNSQPTGAKP